MAIFPVEVFTSGNALVGFTDEYRSAPLAQAFAGQPKGVYRGFIPSVTPPSPFLTLGVDPGEGFSLIKLPSQGDPAGLDLIATSPILLDFTGQPPGDFPIHVVARANYTDDPSTPTTGEIITRPAAAVAFNEVLICVIDGPVLTLSVAFNASLGERDEPLAFSGVEFGFMPAGSIEDLADVTDRVNEVVAARVGLDSTVHASLSDRLAADQSASSMASRLALHSTILRSNEHSAAAGATQINVSASFSEVERQFDPKITLGGSGSETQAGAIAAPNDAVRNVCLIVDALTGHRPVDDPNTRRLIFGRLEGPTDNVISGTWTFTNAATSVLGVNGSSLADLQNGDLLLGPDGLYYEVADRPDNDTITLSSAFQGVTATTTAVSSRRFLLNLLGVLGSTEQETSFPVPTTIRFYFPAFVGIERGNMDWSMALHTAAEREPIPNATTSVAGIGLLAEPGALLGTINIQNAGAPLAGGPFHTINFNAANASIIPGVGPSELEVAEIGQPGAQGPPGSSGGPGNPGPTGPGITEINTFEISGTFAGTPASPPVPFSFTRDMGHTIRNLGCGIASWEDDFTFAQGLDIVQILSVSGVGTNIGQVDGDIAQDTQCTIFMTSAGD